MTLRSRLAWAFSAMLLVPLAVLILIGALARWWLDPQDGASAWSIQTDFRPMEILNAELKADPAGLVEGAGFDRLAAALPKGISLGSWADDGWVKTTPGFFDASYVARWHNNAPRTLFVWNFDSGARGNAHLEVRWSPRLYMEAWGIWALVGFLGLLTLLIGTNGVLTWLVSRSVLRPLAVLERAAKRLGEGDLEPGPLPTKPQEFRRVGQTFDDLRQRLKDSLSERQALEEERRTWVASVSHDLRTPLAVIRGYAEGLRDGVASGPERQNRYQAVILERALQMERQIDDLFQWARWDWGQPKLQMQALDLAEELGHATLGWAADWPELELAWVPSSGSWPILADPLALRRIFDNLARNVVQHGGPKPTLDLQLEEVSGGFSVGFRDHGPGLSDAIRPRVFERFFRGDPARNPGQGGGGLGLTIAQTLAQSCGGSMAAANHPDGGALFTLTLPKAKWQEENP